jgi:hypothetical protein
VHASQWELPVIGGFMMVAVSALVTNASTTALMKAGMYNNGKNF